MEVPEHIRQEIRRVIQANRNQGMRDFIITFLVPWQISDKEVRTRLLKWFNTYRDSGARHWDILEAAPNFDQGPPKGA